MGFSQKDLGDVVWSSETSRDPTFLTSRPKDIAYPNSFDLLKSGCQWRMSTNEIPQETAPTGE